jgi:NADPH2:quinone reductase
VEDQTWENLLFNWRNSLELDGSSPSPASAANSPTLEKLGATQVIDRHLSPEVLAEEIQKVFGADGVQHLFDCVSWEYSFSVSVLSRTKPSTLLTLHSCEVAEELVRTKGINCRVEFIFGNSEFLQPLTKDFRQALPEWIEDGALAVSKYRVVEGLDLNQVEDGLDSYRDGKPVTPLIVHPQGGIMT